jgi:predicted MPP superfamily phosphohydrolase
VCPETVGLFDLQLSGHTHRGQIFPFSLFVALMYPLFNGTHDMGEGSVLHTSRGTGTWGPPIRVLAPPEITVIEIVRKD